MDEEAFLEEVKVSVDGTNYSLKDFQQVPRVRRKGNRNPPPQEKALSTN